MVLRLVVAITFPKKLIEWEGARARQLLEQQFGLLKENKLLSEKIKEKGVDKAVFKGRLKQAEERAGPERAGRGASRPKSKT